MEGEKLNNSLKINQKQINDKQKQTTSLPNTENTYPHWMRVSKELVT